MTASAGGSSRALPNRASESDDALSWLALEPDEALRWRGRPRVQTLYPWLAVTVLGMIAVGGAVALGAVSSLALLSLPVVALLPLWRYVRLVNTEFVITDRRVATKRGVIGRSVSAVALDRVQNTAVTQGAIGNVVGYGTVRIETAGGSNPTFRHVDTPFAVRAELEATAERRTRRVPGTRTQWTAVLESVRGWRRELETKRDGDG